MNQGPPYMDMHAPAHMTSGPPYTQAPSHYAQYQAPQPMAPASSYSTGYPHAGYGYPGSVTSPQSAGPHMQQSLPLPAMMPSANPQHSYGPANPTPAHTYQSQQPFDTTGQIAPPGMKPRVTATLWEDEGSLCFQVEAKGVCVARREDNHFINGTKLLNVAGMTRGRRDGILKSEKVRHVVKIGPMHLKGVWIPFDRALEFANKEKITDILYPLFVHNIGGLLYSPENANRTNAVVAASENRRRMDSADPARPGQPAQAPPLTHHHSMQASVGGQVPSTPHSLNGQATGPRPGIDRAHTFPTPPTSASSVMGMSSSGNYNDWSGQSMSNGVAPNQPLSIDTGNMNNTRSMPTTPATTPPGQNVQNMQGYPQHQGYGDSKHYYATTPSSQNGYAHPPSGRYDGYKTDMGPPTAPNTGGPDGAQGDHKNEYTGGHPGSDNSEHHENGYVTNSVAPYPPNRNQYGYNAAEVSPEMTSSPHQAGSGRGTPRTLPSGQPQWGGEYRTPPQTNAGGIYNVVGDTRAPASGPLDAYSNAAYNHGVKRRREDDDVDGRPASREYSNAYDPKRQKLGRPAESFGMPLPTAHMQAIKTGR